MSIFDVEIDNTYDNSYLLYKTNFTINELSSLNKIDLRNLMTPLGYYEFLGSTANSLATLIEYDIPDFRCSRQFLYYNERLNTDTYNINSSIKSLLEYGFCSYNDYPYNPININVNDYSFTINIKKSKKFENTLNIFIYDKICGSIKNNILKTNSPEIYNDVAIVGAIFLSYLIYKGVEDFISKDYDKHYSRSES